MKRIKRVNDEGTVDVNGHTCHVQFVDYVYEDEAVSKNIGASMDDFYNLLHLIEKAWTSKRYVLVPSWQWHKVGFDVKRTKGRISRRDWELYELGMDVIHKEEYPSAWISIGEKYGCIEFIIRDGLLERRAEKIIRKSNNGKMLPKGVDEDENWVYTDLELAEIIKADDVTGQQGVVRQWIEENINPLLG